MIEDFKTRMNLYELFRYDTDKEYGDRLTTTLYFKGKKYVNHINKMECPEMDKNNLYLSRQFMFGIKVLKEIPWPLYRGAVYGSQVVFRTDLISNKEIMDFVRHIGFHCLVKGYQLPQYEEENFDKMCFLYWVARRNRILGKIFLNFEDQNVPHDEIYQAVIHQFPDLKKIVPAHFLNGVLV